VRVRVAEEERDVASAAKALLRSVVVQATAVDTLNDTQVAEAGAVNVRVMLDTAADLIFMLRSQDRLRSARKYHITAYLEVQAHFRATGADDATMADLAMRIDHARTVDREAFQEVLHQRSGRGPGRYHWSGLSRSEIARRVETRVNGIGPISRAFKVFSWDTHSVMAGLRDVREIEIDGEQVYEHAHWQTQAEAAEFNASVAFNALACAWQVFAESFAIPLGSSIPEADD
jgi:hypothetical protein